MQREGKRESPGPLAPLFMFFFSPPPGPALCKLGNPGGMFLLPEVLTLVLGPSFVLFSRAFPFFVFQPLPFWTPFSYSSYLTQINDTNAYQGIFQFTFNIPTLKEKRNRKRGEYIAKFSFDQHSDLNSARKSCVTAHLEFHLGKCPRQCVYSVCEILKTAVWDFHLKSQDD